MRSKLKVRALIIILFGLGLAACSDSNPSTSSQGKWLGACQSDDECGDASDGLSCICGTCSTSCEDDTACSDTPGASVCYASNTSTTYVLCGGQAEAKSLCLPECDPDQPDTCGAGKACIQAACMTLASLPSTIPCGALNCNVGEEYCYGESAGVARDDGTSSSTRECKPIPTACLATPTCECLSDNDESFTSCREVYPGAIEASTEFPSARPTGD